MNAATTRLLWVSTVALVAVSATSLTAPLQHGTDDSPPGQTLTPDTLADSIWSYLDNTKYERQWSVWPGQHELDPGREPHGMLQSTYVNEIVDSALASGAAIMPAGALIVKESHEPDSLLSSVLVMYKVTGYDPDSNDWLYAGFQPNGRLLNDPDDEPIIGRVGFCRECHAGRSDRDYLFSSRPDPSP